MLTLLVYILVFLGQECLSQRGEFYPAGSTILSSPSAENVQNLGAVNFLGASYSDAQIKITFHGIVSIDNGREPSTPTSCPTDNIRELSLSVIAPYWLPNTHGSVQLNHRPQLTANLRGKLACDIESTFLQSSGDFSCDPDNLSDEFQKTADAITSVTIITWTEMENRNLALQNQKNTNSFQLVLAVGSGNSLHALMIYRVLNFDGEHRLDGKDQECPRRSLVGFNRADIHSIFFMQSQIGAVALYTNLNDYELLGRYTYELSGDTSDSVLRKIKQPQRNCAGKEPDPFCVDEWVPIVNAKVSKEFCRYRETGLYPHPLKCNRYIYCADSAGGLRKATLKECPTGLNFNRFLSVCDWKAHVECFFPELIFRNNLTESRNLSRPTNPPARHNNSCLFRAHGDIPDPLSCENFLTCSHSKSYLMSCPIDPVTNLQLYFVPTSENAGICEYQDKVNCVNGTRPSTETTTTTTTTTTTATTTQAAAPTAEPKTTRYYR